MRITANLNFLKNLGFAISLIFFSYYNVSNAQNISNPSAQNVEYHGGSNTPYPYGQKAWDWDTTKYVRYFFQGNAFPSYVLPYRMYTPTIQNATQKLPLFIMLHGRGEGIGEGCDQGMVNKTNTCPLIWGGRFHLDNQAAHPSYVVFPNTGGGYWGNSSAGNLKPQMADITATVLEMVEHLIATKNIDPDKVYIAGLSAGASGAWEFVERRPDLFAAHTPMSGLGITNLADTLANIPIWMFQGGKDINPAPIGSQDMYDSIVKHGGNPIRTNNKDRDHWAWVDAYTNSQWLNWVYAQNKRNITIQYGGVPKICTGISPVTLGISEGFSSYQWQKLDGGSYINIPLATSNEYSATAVGRYQVKFVRKGQEVISNPVTLTENNTSTPKPIVNLENSPILGNEFTSVRISGPIAAPNSPMTYQWNKNGLSFSTARSLFLTIADQGKYSLQTRLQANCPSPASDTVYVGPAPVVGGLNAPSNLVVNSLGQSSITLQWQDNASNELGYDLQYSSDGGGTYFHGGQVPANNSTGTISNLNPNTIYTLRVRAFNASGTSAFSATTVSSTQADVIKPTSPSGLSSINITDKEATFYWNSSSDNVKVTSYEIYRNGIFYNYSFDTTYSVSDLQPGTQYSFYIVAKDASGNASLQSNTLTLKTATIGNGVNYAYYEAAPGTEFNELPNYSLLTPLSSPSAYQNNFTLDGVGGNPVLNKTSGDNFAMKYEGLIDIPFTGNYTFYTTSDDGSKLFIDNNNIVNNDGAHGTIEQQGSVFLNQGKHPIQVQYFEKGGSNVLFVRWTGPAGSGISDRSPIANNLLYRYITYPVSNGAPSVSAGPDVTVILPATSATLTGSGVDGDGPVSFSWRFVSGPLTPSTPVTNTANLNITGLSAVGKYIFELSVIDNDGTVMDSASVFVQNPNSAPVANGGADRSITIPINTVNITGSATDADAGDVLTYLWTKVSGPNSFTWTNQTTLTPTFSNLVVGAYVVRLTATDNKGSAHSDDVTISVLSSGISIQSLVLLDRNSNDGFNTIRATLFDGYVLEEGTFGVEGYSIAAKNTPVQLDSMIWYLDGNIFRKNDVPNDGPPYVMTWNNFNDGVTYQSYSKLDLTTGTHVIKAIPYLGGSPGDAYQVTIQVVDVSESPILWIGAGNTDSWKNSANWNPNTIPTANDMVRFDNSLTSGGYDVIFDADAIPVKSIDVRTPTNSTDSIRLIIRSSLIADGVNLDLTLNSGTILELQSNLTIAGNLTCNSGKIKTNSYVLNLIGSTTGNLRITSDTIGNINYGASSNQVVYAGTYKNLTISGTGNKTLNGATLVADTLGLTSGTLVSGSTPGNLTIDFSRGGISPHGLGLLTGILHARRNVPAGFHFISSPLIGSTYADLYENLNLTTDGLFVYQESHPSSDIAQGFNFAYNPVPSSQLTGAKYPGGPTDLTGFIVNFPQNTTLNMTGTYAHNGPAREASGLSYTPSGDPTADGWHLIGNPYPSFVDFTKCDLTNVSNSITYYDSQTGQNIVYVPANAGPDFVIPATETNGASQYIPPMQGFWIQTTADNASVRMPNSARTVKPDFINHPRAKRFYRTAANPVKTMKLSVIGENSILGDETVIRFTPITTENFDNDLDAYKFINDDKSPSLYSVINKIEYAVNSLPLNYSNQSIPLKLIVHSAGNYVLDLKESMTFNEGSSIVLYDKVLGISHDLLLNKTYKFNTTIEAAVDRFYINVVESITANETENNSNIYISLHGNEANIVFEKAGVDKASVYVSNTLGQHIMTLENAHIGNGVLPLHFAKQEHGIYLIKVVTSDKTYTKKIYIK